MKESKDYDKLLVYKEKNMKKKYALSLITLLFLSSCNIFSSPSSSIEESNQLSSEESSSSNFSLEEESGSSSEAISITTQSPSTSEIDYSKLSKIILDSSSCSSGLFRYRTGSYGDFYDTTRFDFYRAYKEDGELLRLLPYTSPNSVQGLNSAFFNRNKIEGIKRIDLTYKTSSNQERPIIKFGETRFYSQEYQLDYVEEFTTISIELNQDNIRYFSLETSTTLLMIEEIEIFYLDNFSYEDEDKARANEGLYRINLETMDSSSLIPGVSKVEVPTKIEINEEYYQVKEVKEYTYYTYEYITNNKNLVEDASLVDPIDVANYFISFGTYPVNYVSKRDYSNAYSIFGKDTRCVSSYSRTDGYALAVPYQSDNYGKPSYYECDIALDDSYSSSSRGVGRLVVWEYGFDANKGAKNYSSSPVCVYTDDHYATFREYLNYGVFGRAFDAESERSFYRWSCPTTLILEENV